MEHQKTMSQHPLLSSTSRQFYTRRVPQRQNSQAHLDKILRTLNRTHIDKAHRKLKTQNREEQPDLYNLETELEQIKTLTKSKLTHVLKKQQKQWKELLMAFQNYTQSSSKETLLMNEINFLSKMMELTKNQTVSVKELPKPTRSHPVKNIETVRLFKENQLLREQLIAQQSNKVKQIEANHVSTPEPTEEQLDHKKQQYKAINELQSEAEILRETNDLLRGEKKSLQEKVAELKNANQNLCEEIVKTRYFNSQSHQKFQMWKNIMSMQHQQILTLKRDQQMLKNELSDLNKKYQTLLRRVAAQNSKDQNKIAEITKKHIEVFNEQIQAFQRVRLAVNNKGYLQTRHPLKDSNSLYQTFMNDRETVRNIDGIKKAHREHFQYYKPSFYVFLEKYFEYQGVDADNHEQIALPVSMSFINTLRAILDSKHNEYLISKNRPGMLTPLPNFTIAWLSNFAVDKKSKEQEAINTDVCFETIGSFYIRLMNPYLNNNWEVITFREFLLESLSTDQLLFFLKARFLLLRGDGLAGKGAFMEVFYVNYVDALFLIQQIVIDFDYRKKLQDYLKRMVEFQKKNHLVDAHFILRMLLEYYQFKKAEIFSHLAKTFSHYLKERNVSMPFQIFIKIFDYNSFELSLSEIVEIFQKAYSLGRGHVHLENIFTVINEEGFLCRQVQKMFQSHPIFKQSTSPNNSQKDTIHELFQRIIQVESAKLGLEQTKKQGSELTPTLPTSFENVVRKIETVIQLALFNLKKMFYTKKLTEEDFSIFLPVCLPLLKEVVKLTIDKKQSLQLLELFLKKEAAKQILHFYRKKKAARNYFYPYEHSNKIPSRTESIKQQFNLLIQHLKMKYKQPAKIASEKSLEDQQDF